LFFIIKDGLHVRRPACSHVDKWLVERDKRKIAGRRRRYIEVTTKRFFSQESDAVAVAVAVAASQPHPQEWNPSFMVTGLTL
jgi:hypothetical protein